MEKSNIYLLRMLLGLILATIGLVMPGLFPAILFNILGGFAIGSGLSNFCILKERGE